MKKRIHILGNEVDIWHCLEKCLIELGGICYYPTIISERRICFWPRMDISLVYNSFAPVVECAFHNNASFIELILSFSLKKSVRIIAVIIIDVSTLLEVLFVYWHYTRGLLGSAIVAPIVFLLYFVCFIGIGAKIEISRFIKALLQVLNENGFQEGENM